MKNRVLVFSAVTAIVAAFAWGGCSSEDDSNGTAGTAGTAGKAGAAGKAGSAGKAGAAGEAGAAGSTAGGAGEAGAAGSTAGGAGEAGAAGSTAGAAGSTAGAAGSTAGSAGSTGDCKDILPDECGTCIETNCCPEGAACKSTTGCVDCITGDDTACTDANEDAAIALYNCADTNCQAECFGGTTIEPACGAPAVSPSNGACVTVGGVIECNPVTNAGCDTAAGEACDFSQDGYTCYPAPNDADLCGACDSSNGPFCKGGMTCPGGKCAKFCCDDGDCGTGGVCDKSFSLTGGIGLCLPGTATDGGTPPADAANDTTTPPADAAAE